MTNLEQSERQVLLEDIRRRLEDANLFFPTIWDRLLCTKLAVLREIATINFEREVGRKMHLC